MLGCHRDVREYARFGGSVYHGGIGCYVEHGGGCASVDDNVKQRHCDRAEHSSVRDRTRCCRRRSGC